MSAAQRQQLAEWLRDLFASDITKLILSTLIILSLLPLAWVQSYGLVFFAFFALELYGRLLVLLDDFRQRRVNRVEIAFFILDVVATLSFLPVEMVWQDIRLLRLFRLSRMLLLFGYWAPIVRELWTIVIKRERLYQILFAGSSALILCFLCTLLLHHFQAQAVDFDGDGRLGNESFWSILWWSFRQIESPDNLLHDATASLGFFCSVLLTLSGFFVLSFLIGIATSIVDDLVRVGREQPVGWSRHSVICNIGPYAQVLLEELIAYYTKSLRSPKIVTMGLEPARYSFMYEPALRRIRYREGRPLSAHDLRKVDAGRARRVILLDSRSDGDADAAVIAQILAVRAINPDCAIYAEMQRHNNVQAALAAGGPRTVPILADRLVNLLLANIVLFPGMEELYGDLLTSRGNEIYTCQYGQGALLGQQPPSGPLFPFDELLERAHRAHGVILLGHLLADEHQPTGFRHSLNPGACLADGSLRPSVPPVDALRGFFAVASNFEMLRGCVESLPDIAAAPAPGRKVSVPSFALCPTSSGLANVLIYGFREHLVEVCEQLILLGNRPQLYLVLPGPEQLARTRAAFLDYHLEAGEPPSTTRVRFSATPRKNELRYTLDSASGEGGAVHLLTGDWSHERTMLADEASGYRLAAMDAVLFTSTFGEADPDARTALGLLKLLPLVEERRAEVKPQLRVVCEVQSTEQAELLRHHFGRRGQSHDACPRLAIISSEMMRNALLAQAVFVPGIAAIWEELLREGGQQIRRLLVSGQPDPTAELTFGELLLALYRRDELIALAVELRTPEGTRRLVVNPSPKSECYRFHAGELVAVFAVAESTRLARAASSCSACSMAGAQ